ncbi:hypothetical protein GOP47_0013356 [Adiantum capillus-veneris]|uniref:Xyloglucan endotransglucosylase/hydrolase n=1 Tax=Adiantum capillus-veneris TaxID=13818 RepID=A0A9D4UNK8_ADICA|nr:hypothetical protein GOP47_0013356 [Adiantum capillus-veneris]
MKGVKGAKCQPPAAPPAGEVLTELFPCTPFDKAFANRWAPEHQLLSADHSHVSLSLDRSSAPGVGFQSTSAYVSGLFSGAMKLPGNPYTAGVVISFYLSNADIFPNEHDEVNFSLLGRIPGEEFILQTSIYANGSTDTGREQRIRLWFDPTKDYHHYTIVWTSKHIVFYVDDTPIRELSRAMVKEQYPIKKMFVYGTIWDGSNWATNGGKFTANYTYAPFIAEFSHFVSNGCKMKSPTTMQLNHNQDSSIDCDCEFNLIPAKLNRYQRRSISWVQQNYMTYNYCDDSQRYPKTLPECLPLPDAEL